VTGQGLSIFGLPEPAFRFGTFVAVLLAMMVFEALWPRRARRHARLRRWATNLGVLGSSYLAVALVTLVVPVTAVLAAIWAQNAGWGLFNVLDWPVWLEGVLAFLVLDFVIWGQHLIMHKVPFLWRAHRVHHADHDLDASTAVRFHPLEILLSIGVKALAVIVLGAPALVVVLFEAFVNAAALFNHANLNLPPWLDRWLRPVVVTPDMHLVHHSAKRAETNSNYGFALSIWDRLFRTYVREAEGGRDGMTVGLAQWQDDRPTRLGFSLLLPFVGTKRD